MQNNQQTDYRFEIYSRCAGSEEKYQRLAVILVKGADSEETAAKAVLDEFDPEKRRRLWVRRVDL